MHGSYYVYGTVTLKVMDCNRTLSVIPTEAHAALMGFILMTHNYLVEYTLILSYNSKHVVAITMIT